MPPTSNPVPPGVSRLRLASATGGGAGHGSFTRMGVRLGVATVGTAVLVAAGSVSLAGTASAAPPSTRIAGADRYATAAAAALSGWDHAETVVVASGAGGTDALAASSMAGALDSPVLLTGADAAPAATLAALKALSPSFVVVLGGTSAVSPSAFSRLTAGTTATRISGADRYATAAAVLADFHASLDPATGGGGAPAPADAAAAWPDGTAAGSSGVAGTSAEVGSPDAAAGPGRTAYLARGDVAASDVPADALAVSPQAWRTRTPVLLTTRDALPAATAAAIRSGGIKQVVVLGGPAAVSDGVAAAVAALGVKVERVAGPDRSGTAAALADRFVAGGGSAARVGLASGRSVDALAAGPVAGKAGYPLLLTGSPTDLGSGTRAWLSTHAGAAVTVIGGTSAVSAAAVVSAGG